MTNVTLPDSAPAAPLSKWRRPIPRWKILESDREVVQILAEALALEQAVASVLVARKLTHPEQARDFLLPQLASLHDPFAMRDMAEAASRLWKAIEARESILLYGDYDVDGTTSIVILKKLIEILGGSVRFHVPNRLTEGYGMRPEVITQAARDGVTLVVSVDTGIRAQSVVAHARNLELDVIVTDHHLPEAELPPALAVLNPNRPDCAYPNKHLCGAGVTFKLIQAVLHLSALPVQRRDVLLDSFLKPVAIATVADIVPLTGENRLLVHRGLSGLRDVRNPGLQALLRVAGFDAGEAPTAHQVAFRLAPRINAAGRMASANDVVELFLTDKPERARQLAEMLDGHNRERQQVETEIVEQILAQCEEAGVDSSSRALVFSGSGWHPGVLGIVASRLVERFHRPIFVLSDAGAQTPSDGATTLSGSGRSIPAFHLLQALETMPELFAKFGGHRQAAGLTLSASDLEIFRARLAHYADGCLTDNDLCPEFTVDAPAGFDELSERAIRQILGLGPFGFGNPTPTLIGKCVQVAGPARVKGNGKLLEVPLRSQGRVLFCKAWGFADRADLFEPGSNLDILYQIEDDPKGRTRGFGSWCVSIKDARKAEP